MQTELPRYRSRDNTPKDMRLWFVFPCRAVECPITPKPHIITRFFGTWAEAERQFQRVYTQHIKAYV